ncbi:fungal specific transcription factor [Stagonosporopsis vannaccii]|nr:fungal specific transcription factor [Stagonosporopsis vannaccii]
MGEVIPVEFAQHATRATDYLILTAILRVAPSPLSTSISTDCTAAARISLHEHTACISLLAGYDQGPNLFEVWINGGLILSPFLSFTIVFCNVIETGHATDLGSLKALVEALHLLSQKPEYTFCAKQLQVFRALYTIAAVHNEVRGRSHFPSVSLPDLSPHGPLIQTPDKPSPKPGHTQPSHDVRDMLSVPQPTLEPLPWLDFGGMDLDPLGTQLGYWIQESGEAFDSLDST